MNYKLRRKGILLDAMTAVRTFKTFTYSAPMSDFGMNWKPPSNHRLNRRKIS